MTTEILPLISIYGETEQQIQQLIEFLHREGNSIRVAVRCPLKDLESLGTDTWDQLKPFLNSGSIHFFPDSLSGSYHGLMNKRQLKSELKETRKRSSEIFPDRKLMFMPRWHDVFRPEAREMYRDILTNVLIPHRYYGNFHWYSLLGSEQHLVPALKPEVDEYQGKIGLFFLQHRLNHIEKKIQEMIQHRELHASGTTQIILEIETSGTDFPSEMLQQILELREKGREFTSGFEQLSFLSYSGTDNTHSRSLPPGTILPALFDPPANTPGFTAQLFPASRLQQEEKHAPVFSSLSRVPHPEQRVEPERPKREITSSMIGQARLKEQELEAVFLNGNITALSSGGKAFHLSPGISSRIDFNGQSRNKPARFEMESAFAVEDEHSRGLRQTLHLKHDWVQIAGRIVNDFLLIGDNRQLYLDSYIQHPWLKDGRQFSEYIPQMITLWDSLERNRRVVLRSMNSDASERNINIDLSLIESRECILLPGSSWVFSSGDQHLGMDLIYGSKNRINLPAACIIEPEKKGQFRISFAPAGIYIRPDSRLVNGLLEHYSLRLIPNISKFEDFGAIERKVYRRIHDPFVIYY
ncbi:hypothetical protein [Salinispira pacifica]|uniref:Uncharacterized protein n=1 Tax=Salinispira pacifica TaxID=1307761 RepID=V5WKL3_9SPIO|nr:hypothetical protein [Salinispira pacifica]AHC16367.1 hypothetical protein L21SP2_3023 [Salinispira pacifica]